MIAATRAVRRCDVFIAIGTSGEVAPANELVLIARAAGALTVRVNPTTDPASLFDVDVPITAGTQCATSSADTTLRRLVLTRIVAAAPRLTLNGPDGVGGWTSAGLGHGR